MASRLWDTLMRFHHEVIIPDIERIVGERIDARILPLRDEMLTNFDHVYTRFDRLESEVVETNAALKRVEERVTALEEKFGS